MSDKLELLNDIIISSLNLKEPYYMSDLKIDEDKKEIYIEIGYQEGTKFSCPNCKCESSMYDKLNKKWRHTDFIKYKVFVECKTPRVNCSEHGVKLIEVDWAKQRHRFTKTMEQFIIDLSKEMPLVHVGKVVEEHDTRIRRIVGSRNEKIN